MKRVTHEEYKDIVKQMALLMKTVQRKYYKKPTINSLRTSSSSKRNQYKEKYEDKRVKEKPKAETDNKCYNCSTPGHFARDFKKLRFQDLD